MDLTTSPPGTILTNADDPTQTYTIGQRGRKPAWVTALLGSGSAQPSTQAPVSGPDKSVRTAKTRSQPQASAPTSLTIGLHDPGMTPLFRAGLGGLAASFRAIGETVLEGTGSIQVEPERITLSWPPGGAAAFFEKLFSAAFRIDTNGLIDLPGSYRSPGQRIDLRAGLNEALRRTFLQHGSSAKKDGKPAPTTIDFGDQQIVIGVQRLRRFNHQDGHSDIAAGLDKNPAKAGTIQLAGWANPGAACRHVAFSTETEVAYTQAQAICACFAITGCLSLCGPGKVGVLVIPEPADLIRFAAIRPQLSPRDRREATVGSAGDAALTVHIALRADAVIQHRDAIAAVHVTTMSPLAWVAGGQKVRVDTLLCEHFRDVRLLDAFVELTKACPPREIPTRPKTKDEPGGLWTIPSSLRSFVSDNLARGRPWFRGFAFARTRDDPPRWIHRFYSAADKLGGLRFPDDHKGLIAMSQSLDDTERLLVASIHTALRNRFGAIFEENKGNPVAFKNRCQGERDKWRLAISGAKTHDHVRSALADLWSRAGTVRELQHGWQQLLPMLKPDRWQDTRDLGLIALASYQGKGANADPVTDEPLTTTEPN